MHREYQKWYSPSLGRDMEMLVFGHAGTPLLVFPTSKGRFFEYEDRGMISCLWHQYEHGHVQAFCVDSADAESWYNRGVHPADRARRHIAYDYYLQQEVLPFLRWKNPHRAPVATGCSFGGYHAVNFAFRHPYLVSGCVSMGGAFDIKQFLDGYYDDNCYFNNPPDFLPNLGDHARLEQMRRLRIVLATGEHDICLHENLRLGGILNHKGIPHWLDVWGDHTGHDWPWWQRMAQKHFV